MNRLQTNQMVTRRQSKWPEWGANHKEARGSIKEQHVFDFHSLTDDIWQVKGTHDARSWIF